MTGKPTGISEEPGEMGQAAPEPEIIERNGKGRKKLLKPKTLIPIVVLAALAGVFGVKHWTFSRTHVGTDDAYVTSDNTIIAPQVSGTVKQVLVSENQPVKQGQLLVVLDDSTYQAAVAQARANLDMAVAQAEGAGASVDLAAETGSAQITQAQGLVQQAESGIAGAEADTVRTDAAVGTARASAKSAAANVKTAEAAVSAAIANKKRASDSIGSAQANVDAAQAVYNKAARDAERMRSLKADGAISDQAFDQSESALLTAKAALVGRQADLSAAKQQLSAADASIDQAKAQLAAAREQADAAQAGVRQAEAVKQASYQGVRQAKARREQAIGQLSQAHTSPVQVSVTKSAKAQALAKVEQARAALDDALLKLSYTRISAPSDGTVSKKSIEVGSLVQAGTPLMYVVDGSSRKVVANYKETQLRNVRAGQSAEIEVDALHGKSFRGHVDSISPGTGATFALLPADNATGNFTKVVQRVPVKIVLDKDQPGLDDLRTGFSVTAVICTR